MLDTRPRGLTLNTPAQKQTFPGRLRSTFPQQLENRLRSPLHEPPCVSTILQVLSQFCMQHLKRVSIMAPPQSPNFQHLRTNPLLSPATRNLKPNPNLVKRCLVMDSSSPKPSLCLLCGGNRIEIKEILKVTLT
ncbi:hypothetical protein ATANTOWER_016272 [Ataeniobius toweri]|uniref:Uncharacterized protein n=1 Tax=Ataeniobius toweri TaxID=208326 RepID=A0ABU7BHX6_9TELE|nr:hypothetical protein [Ataeniobius toweri]